MHGIRHDSESALATAEAVRSGLRTPREVIVSCLERIAAVDATIGAFQVVAAEAALRDAGELAGREDLSRLPLAGVPVAVKDNVDVAGLPTRHGSAATSASPAAHDDELVRRLRQAGAIIVGKTRMPELAAWGFTESPAHGGSRNPHDPTRNAGGSTGGGAAAVAAGLVPLALGSDGGGSLRIPAANCGVVGFKPSRGLVPLAGPAADHWFGCTVFGPIATTVADAALALDVLVGQEGRHLPVPLGRPLRVAVSLRSPSPFSRPDARARHAVATVADLLRTAGHQVTDTDPPYPLTLINTWGNHWLAGIAEEADRLGLAPGRLEPRTRSMIRFGRLARRLVRPGSGEAWARRAMAWFADHDVLVTPTVAAPAPLAGAMTGAGFVRTYLQAARTIPYTQAWNLAGFPALSLPAGRAADGFPLAVQLVAPPGQDARLTAVAAQLEAALAAARAS